MDERIAPQPVVTDATPAPVVENDAPTLSVSHAASTSNALAPPERVMLSGAAPASSSRESVAERMRLRCDAQEVDADRAATELFAEEAAAWPVVRNDEKGQTQEILCFRCTRLDLVRDVLRARLVRDDPGLSLFVVRDSGDSMSQIVSFFVLRYDSFEFGFRNFSEYW